MKNSLIGIVKEFIKVIIIAAIAVPMVVLFAAWTGPSGSPPNNNAEPPINVGPLDQIKSGGWLSLGNLISRGTTLLAGDEGNVGIGFDDATKAPEAKLHVAGGDAIFEGDIQIRGGLPEKDKVLTAVDDTGSAVWKTVTADMLIPQGYKEVFFNAGEDIYGGWTSVSSIRNNPDTCNGIVEDEFTQFPFFSFPLPINHQYACSVESTGVCKDVVSRTSSMYYVNSILTEYFSRDVECRAAKILRKDEWQYAEHKYTGTAVITNLDHDGDHEYCWVDVNFSNAAEGYSCSRSGVRSWDLDEISFPKCRDWLLGEIRGGNICALPFPQNKITSFSGNWDIKTNQDFGEGWVANGSGALDLSFTELK